MNQLTIDITELQHKIALQRDKKAYEQLYKGLYKPLMHFAETILRSREAAEEVFSDVLLKVWTMEHALIDIVDLRSYLYRSMRNASLNYLARYSKVKVVEFEKIALDTTSGNDVLQEMTHTELKQKLALVVKSLPEKCQLVYRLIKEHGLSYKQVAEVLKISPNTVEGHMTTALKKISDGLRPYLQS